MEARARHWRCGRMGCARVPRTAVDNGEKGLEPTQAELAGQEAVAVTSMIVSNQWHPRRSRSYGED